MADLGVQLDGLQAVHATETSQLHPYGCRGAARRTLFPHGDNATRCARCVQFRFVAQLLREPR